MAAVEEDDCIIPRLGITVSRRKLRVAVLHSFQKSGHSRHRRAPQWAIIEKREAGKTHFLAHFLAFAQVLATFRPSPPSKSTPYSSTGTAPRHQLPERQVEQQRLGLTSETK